MFSKVKFIDRTIGKYVQRNRIDQMRALITSCNEIGYNEKGLVLGIYEGDTNTDDLSMTTSAAEFNKKTENRLKKLIKGTALTGHIGSSMLFNNIDVEYRSIAVVGLGKEGIGYNNLEAIEEGMENARVAAAIGANVLADDGCSSIHIEAMEYPECVAEGSGLAMWRYQENKAEDDRILTPKLQLYGSPEQDAWIRGSFKAHAQNLARDLCEMPANQMTPTAFAQATVDALCLCGVNVEVRTMDWIESKHMSSFLAVAQSSCEPAVFLEINYCGGEMGDKPILLAGKGITYNSGGLCLKDSNDLPEYRSSMAGAAVIVATIRAIAALSLPINVSAVIPLCENMPSGKAFKPGDIIKCLNGKTIAVHDTNNAGVLLLADAIIYAEKFLRPKLIVNVATISNGIQKAFGGASSGVFSNSSVLWDEMLKAGSITGDRVWRLPLWKYFSEKVTQYPDVDISNTGQGKASACLGAAILKQFITCPYWMHLDIRGVGMMTTTAMDPYFRKFYMTGRPTRTLIQFLYQLACRENELDLSSSDKRS